MLWRLAQNGRLPAIAAAFAVVAGASYAFAASNTVPASKAGDGAAAVSGYAVTNIHYNLNTSNPQALSSVTFTIAPAVPPTGTVRVSLDGGVTWVSTCTTGASITCTTSAPVAGITGLRVVAAQ